MSYVSTLAPNCAFERMTTKAHVAKKDHRAAIADGLLAVPPLDMNPLSRIEAWRLLARSRGARGHSAAACEALESAVQESREVGYVWMERRALEDMIEWVEGDNAAATRVRDRIAAVGVPTL